MPLHSAHVTFRGMQRRLYLTFILLAFILMSACRTPGPTQSATVTIKVDGSSIVHALSNETTVGDVLRRANITRGDLDQINPPEHSRISDGMTIEIVRVREEILTVEEPIPFQSQGLPNDNLPPGEQSMVQAGVNGIAATTYRIRYENGAEVSRSLVDSFVKVPPKTEIMMYGSQGDLPIVNVKGVLAFISARNAWIIRQNSGNKRALTEDGGVDGRVFELSPDGRRLLFTRSNIGIFDVGDSEDAAPTQTPLPDEPINSLWYIANTTDQDSEPVRLDLDNILYADWVPGSERTIVYSTAEPAPGWPGWAANNDLWTAQISANGTITREQQLLGPSGGGVYGFYGTFFSFAPDGIHLAWSQADAVGVLVPDYSPDDDDEEETDPDRTPTPTATPDPSETPEPTRPLGLPPAYERQTLASFAPAQIFEFIWRPGITWSPDGNTIVTTTHGDPVGGESDEESRVYNLRALSMEGTFNVELVARAGIWSMAQFSPPNAESLNEPMIAYLEATNPLDSIVSRYRLVVMDRDGSNRRYLFPEADDPGITSGDLDYKGFTWSPDGRQIAIIYQGNLYLIDVVTGLHQQISQDGLARSPRWAP